MECDWQANLALIRIHFDKDINLDEVVTTFARLHPRHLELDYVIKPLLQCH